MMLGEILELTMIKSKTSKLYYCIITQLYWCYQLFVAGGPHKGTQTEASLFGTSCSANSTASSLQPDGILPQCNCDAKMVFNELKDQLQQEHDADKDDALKSLEERVGTSFFIVQLVITVLCCNVCCNSARTYWAAVPICAVSMWQTISSRKRRVRNK